MSVPLLNGAGRLRAPVTLPGYLAGRQPRNMGLRYPPDPPPVEEIVAVMRQAGDCVRGPHAGLRRAALARGAAHHRGPHRHRARPRPAARSDTGPARQARPAARGRRQRLPRVLTHPHGKQPIDLSLNLRRRRVRYVSRPALVLWVGELRRGGERLLIARHLLEHEGVVAVEDCPALAGEGGVL
jgi:hypothetical protein